jgi:hypothetical protein
MQAKELRINLREYSWWTIEELAAALEISKEEAQVRADELLAFEVIEEVPNSGRAGKRGADAVLYRFIEKEEDKFSRYRNASTIYLQIPHDCKITLVKHGLISTLLQEWERWRWNRAMSKEHRIRTKAAEKYQQQWAANVSLMRNRFTPRY